MTSDCAPEIRTGPINECIYCGDTTSPLTDEHIIPDGLGGTHILCKASCLSCAEVIKPLETHIMRHVLEGPRRHLGIHSSKTGASRIAELDRARVFRKTEDGQRVEVVALVADEPPIYIVWLLTDGVPGLLRGRFTPRPRSFAHVDFGPDAFGTARRFSEKADIPFGSAQGIEMDVSVNLGLVARALAKIAHAYAVSKVGLDGFEPLLPSIILDDPTRLGAELNYLDVVSSRLEPEVFLSLHDVAIYVQRSLADKTAYVVCAVRVFSALGLPTAEIVVGRAKQVALDRLPERTLTHTQYPYRDNRNYHVVSIHIKSRISLFITSQAV